MTRGRRKSDALFHIVQEMNRQDKTWGEQQHPSGTGPREIPLVRFDTLAKYAEARDLAEAAKHATEKAARDLDVKWSDILLEEVFEAMAERGGSRALYDELTQIAAVCVQWMIDPSVFPDA